MKNNGTGRRDVIHALGAKKETIKAKGGDDDIHAAEVDAGTRIFGGGGDDRVLGVHLDLTGEHRLKDLEDFHFRGGRGDDSVFILVDVEEKKGKVKLSDFKPDVKGVETVRYDLRIHSDRDRDDPYLQKVLGTGKDDEMTVSLGGVPPGTSLLIKGGGGDDEISYDVYNGGVRVLGGGGDDVIQMGAGVGAVAKGGGGKDDFIFETPHHQHTAYGGGGADDFFLASIYYTSQRVLVGGGGKDRYYVEHATWHNGAVVDFNRKQDKIVVHGANGVERDEIVFGSAADKGSAALLYAEDTGELYGFGRLMMTLENAPELDRSNFKVIEDELLV